MAAEFLAVVLVSRDESVVDAKCSNEPLVGISPRLNFADDVSIPGTIVAYAGDDLCTSSWIVDRCLGQCLLFFKNGGEPPKERQARYGSPEKYGKHGEDFADTESFDRKASEI